MVYVEINVNQYKAFKSSSYIPLPNNVEKWKTCVNITNSDYYCYKWSIIAAMYSPKLRGHLTVFHNIQ